MKQGMVRSMDRLKALSPGNSRGREALWAKHPRSSWRRELLRRLSAGELLFGDFEWFGPLVAHVKLEGMAKDLKALILDESRPIAIRRIALLMFNYDLSASPSGIEHCLPELAPSLFHETVKYVLGASMSRPETLVAFMEEGLADSGEGLTSLFQTIEFFRKELDLPPALVYRGLLEHLPFQVIWPEISDLIAKEGSQLDAKFLEDAALLTEDQGTRSDLRRSAVKLRTRSLNNKTGKKPMAAYLGLCSHTGDYPLMLVELRKQNTYVVHQVLVGFHGDSGSREVLVFKGKKEFKDFFRHIRDVLLIPYTRISLEEAGRHFWPYFPDGKPGNEGDGKAKRPLDEHRKGDHNKVLALMNLLPKDSPSETWPKGKKPVLDLEKARSLIVMPECVSWTFGLFGSKLTGHKIPKSQLGQNIFSAKDGGTLDFLSFEEGISCQHFILEHSAKWFLAKGDMETAARFRELARDFLAHEEGSLYVKALKDILESGEGKSQTG